MYGLVPPLLAEQFAEFGITPPTGSTSPPRAEPSYTRRDLKWWRIFRGAVGQIPEDGGRDATA
jgi:hypothetical protein